MQQIQQELTQEFLTAIGDADFSGDNVLGFSFEALLRAVMRKALEIGREFRDVIEAAAKEVVDRLVAIDIPGLPEQFEGPIDEAMRGAGYDAIEYALTAIFGAS